MFFNELNKHSLLKHYGIQYFFNENTNIHRNFTQYLTYFMLFKTAQMKKALCHNREHEIIFFSSHTEKIRFLSTHIEAKRETEN